LKKIKPILQFETPEHGEEIKIDYEKAILEINPKYSFEDLTVRGIFKWKNLIFLGNPSDYTL
jgi:hypothetical protein